MLTQEERWHFDLKGYMVVRQAVPEADIRAMRKQMEIWYEADGNGVALHPPVRSNHAPNKPWWIYNVHYYDNEVFQRLTVNREILRVTRGLTMNKPRLYHVVANRLTKETDETELHGGFTGGFREPNVGYQVANEEIFCSFITVAISLVDVPAGAGFVCIPGSHKSNFQYPEDITVNHGPPTVANIATAAGDVVFFAPITRQGARRWTEDDPSMTVFMRYIHAAQFHAQDDGHWPPFEKQKTRLSQAVYQLEQRDHGQRQALYDLMAQQDEQKGAG